MRLKQYLIEAKFNPLNALKKVAKYSASFDEFEKYYIIYINHGYFWHLTDNPNFTIDPKKGPRDMSSMATTSQREATPGALMVTSDIKYWHDYYGKERQYAALIDLSDIHPSKLRQVSRGFGNEIFLDKSILSKAKLIDVYPIKTALRKTSHFQKIIPQSEKELKELYNEAK
jgi:hypothetical protein